MGFDCGFDIHPRLEATTENKQTYQRFLDEIISTYNDVYDEEGQRPDGKILEMPNDSEYSEGLHQFHGRRVSAYAQQAIPTDVTTSSASAQRPAGA